MNGLDNYNANELVRTLESIARSLNSIEKTLKRMESNGLPIINR